MLRTAASLVCALALTGCSYLGLGGSDGTEPEDVKEAPSKDKAATVKADGRIDAIERNQDVLNKRTQQQDGAIADLRAQIEGIRGEIALARAGGNGSGGVVPLATSRYGKAEPQVDVDARVSELIARLKKDGKREAVVTGVAQEVCALGAEGVEKLVGAMRDRDAAVANAIQRALEQIDPKVSLGPIKKGLTDPAVRVRCLQVLGEIKDDSVVPDLVGYLEDADAEVRFYAADTLAKMQYKDAVPVLIEALPGDDETHRAIAARTLADATGQTFGYRFYDPPEKREASTRLWTAWWKAEGRRFDFSRP